MNLLYNLFTLAVSLILWIPALFNSKLRLFLLGRKTVWTYLAHFRQADKKLIWLHAASLGEFEQGLPVLEALKIQYPDFQFLITFFSPSGYEVKKDKLPGFGVCYLPLDTPGNVQKFLTLSRPEIALFVKYEVWPNYFKACFKNSIPLLMLSAIFKTDQGYFKWYGGFLRKALQQVTHFYVQDSISAALLKNIGLTNTTISGDTRFDRVLNILERDNHLDFMHRFKGSRTCLVAGSTWPEDERVIIPYLKQRLTTPDFCIVFAPHKTDHRTVTNLLSQFEYSAVVHSRATPEDLQNCKVLIIDSVGLLTKIYAYADIAYVGGGFATGLHNTLEPAVFGIPVVIGPNYKGFREAEGLVEAGGVFSISKAGGFEEIMQTLLTNPEQARRAGSINGSFIRQSLGATESIVSGIQKIIG